MRHQACRSSISSPTRLKSAAYLLAAYAAWFPPGTVFRKTIRWHSLLEAGWPACAGHDKGRVSIIPTLRDGDQEVAEHLNARHRLELFRIDEIRLEGEAVYVAEQLHQAAVLLD